MEKPDICPSCRKPFVPENGFYSALQAALVCEPCYDHETNFVDPCEAEELLLIEYTNEQKIK